MKGEVKKKNVTNPNDQQQGRNDALTEKEEQADGQGTIDEAGTVDSTKADAPNTRRQTSRSGRKSRDNFGSYNGY